MQKMQRKIKDTRTIKSLQEQVKTLSKFNEILLTKIDELSVDDFKEMKNKMDKNLQMSKVKLKSKTNKDLIIVEENQIRKDENEGELKDELDYLFNTDDKEDKEDYEKENIQQSNRMSSSNFSNGGGGLSSLRESSIVPKHANIDFPTRNPHSEVVVSSFTPKTLKFVPSKETKREKENKVDPKDENLTITFKPPLSERKPGVQKSITEKTFNKERLSSTIYSDGVFKSTIATVSNPPDSTLVNTTSQKFKFLQTSYQSSAKLQAKVNQIISDSVTLKTAMDSYNNQPINRKKIEKTKIPKYFDYKNPDMSFLDEKTKNRLKKENSFFFRSRKTNRMNSLRQEIEERLKKQNPSILKVGGNNLKSVDRNGSMKRSSESFSFKKKLNNKVNSIIIVDPLEEESRDNGSKFNNTSYNISNIINLPTTDSMKLPNLALDLNQQDIINETKPKRDVIKKHFTTIKFARRSLNTEEISIPTSSSQRIRLSKDAGAFSNRGSMIESVNSHNPFFSKDEEMIPISDVFNITDEKRFSRKNSRISYSQLHTQKGFQNRDFLTEKVYSEIENEIALGKEENSRKRKLMEYLITQSEVNAPVEENIEYFNYIISKIRENLFKYDDLITKDYTELIDTGEIIRRDLNKAGGGIVFSDYTAPKRVSMQNLKNYYPNFIKTIFKGKGNEGIEDFKKWQNHRITLYRISRDKREKIAKVRKENEKYDKIFS